MFSGRLRAVTKLCDIRLIFYAVLGHKFCAILGHAFCAILGYELCAILGYPFYAIFDCIRAIMESAVIFLLRRSGRKQEVDTIKFPLDIYVYIYLFIFVCYSYCRIST